MSKKKATSKFQQDFQDFLDSERTAEDYKYIFGLYDKARKAGATNAELFDGIDEVLDEDECDCEDCDCDTTPTYLNSPQHRLRKK